MTALIKLIRCSASLTIRLTGDRRHSKLAAYLSILSLSPCSLITPTPESFFSFFALLGHLCLSSPRPSRIIWTFIGAFCYCIATAFRANGVLLAGFILWTLFWKEPSPPRQLSLFCAPILVLICIWPLILTQAFAFSRFCLVKGEGRKWCNDTLPNVYAYVQSHYW
jgi:phosphatidylinositol glycan class V